MIPLMLLALAQVPDKPPVEQPPPAPPGAISAHPAGGDAVMPEVISQETPVGGLRIASAAGGGMAAADALACVTCLVVLPIPLAVALVAPPVSGLASVDTVKRADVVFTFVLATLVLTAIAWTPLYLCASCALSPWTAALASLWAAKGLRTFLLGVVISAVVVTPAVAAALLLGPLGLLCHQLVFSSLQRALGPAALGGGPPLALIALGAGAAIPVLAVMTLVASQSLAVAVMTVVNRLAGQRINH